MVSHEQDVPVPEDGGDPVAFAFVQSKTVVVLIDRDAAIELECRLACPDHWLAFHHAEAPMENAAGSSRIKQNR
ncbi:Hypothetical protein NGAL_HAMBI1146_10860 [Neorhizobium galegae bv. officinalis]|nr:Hypothetical protein NGAL_HAMBI490_13720 [Neorhizobium galegae bv. officinalis]CDZ34850.1 Hypothetical protein NGAL_HAMBI1146_10860 [Neorhizobium galegae bv. officinalis]